MQVIHYDYLEDKEFLKLIDQDRNKEQFVKIIALTWDTETPIGEIQGKATAGSINLNGSSSMRRTGSCSLVVERNEFNILEINSMVSINKKIAIQVGFRNHTNQYTDYDIIWFPEGVYIIEQANVNNSTSGLTISLQLNDKMALLSGFAGGTIPAATQFDSYNEYDAEGNLKVIKVPIYQLIRSLVHEFGGEAYERIIVNDIPDRIQQVMRWVGNQDLALIGTSGNAGWDFVIVGSARWQGLDNDVRNSAVIYKYGEDVGYIYQNFYFPEELVCNPGDTVVTVLDKLKGALGNFEYFYDVYGNFVFQEIKNYLNTSLSTLDLNKGLNNDDYLINRSKGKSVYTFEDASLITSYTNSPKYSGIKNDFVVWGERKLSSGVGKLVHYHLAIDTKPTVGNEYFVTLNKNETTGIVRAQGSSIGGVFETTKELADSGKHDPDVYYLLKQQKLVTGATDGPFLYKYNADLHTYIKVHNYAKDSTIVDANHPVPLGIPIVIRTHDWREELYFQGLLAQESTNDATFYYKEMSEYWPKIFNLAAKKSAEPAKNKDYAGMNVYEGAYLDIRPSDLEFYIDFIDSNAKVSELCVRNIGRRTYAVKEDGVNCIFAEDMPDFVLIPLGTPEEMQKAIDECKAKEQKYVQISEDIAEGLATGGTSNSAYELIRSSLHEYTSYNESITVNAIPIYYLEPNTRITVEDNDSGIHGDYMINSFSLPLDVSGTMSLSCTRALERL